MKDVLVTGASGFIGSNLTIHLLQRGCRVRAFHRTASHTLTLKGVEVEYHFGDIRDKDSLRKAMKGCDTVFHTAALVTFWKKQRKEQMAINVGGTGNVVELCLDLGVRKLVHTSSVAALGYRTDRQLIDENTPYNWGSHIGYKYSKHLAELEVLQGVEKGLNATIVNPSIVVGPRDIHFHGGQIVRDIKRGRIPVYVDGGMNIVSVHDVVVGHLAAAERGRNGERYILGGLNLTHKQVFDAAARVLHGKAPRFKVPLWVASELARTFELIGNMMNTKPWITSDLLAGMGMRNWYSIEKANQELGYDPSPVEDAVRQAYEWYAENGLM